MEEKPKRGGWLKWLVVGFSMVAFYVLSIGPFFWLVGKGAVSNNLQFTVYRPVIFMRGCLPTPMAGVMDWYVKQWTPNFVARFPTRAAPAWVPPRRHP